MTQAPAALLLLPVALFSGCSTAPIPVRLSGGQLQGVRHIAVVPKGDIGPRVVAAGPKGGVVVASPPAVGGNAGAAGLVVLAGWLIVVAAASVAAKGMEAALDERRAAELRPHVQTLSPRTVLIPALVQTLHASGRMEVDIFDAEPSADSGLGVDAVLLVRISSWGFQQLREGDPFVAAFVEIQPSMRLAGTSEPMWSETETIIGRGRWLLKELNASPDLIREELKETLERAGLQLAAELLYPRSGTR